MSNGVNDIKQNFADYPFFFKITTEILKCWVTFVMTHPLRDWLALASTVSYDTFRQTWDMQETV